MSDSIRVKTLTMKKSLLFLFGLAAAVSPMCAVVWYGFAIDAEAHEPEECQCECPEPPREIVSSK